MALGENFPYKRTIWYNLVSSSVHSDISCQHLKPAKIIALHRNSYYFKSFLQIGDTYCFHVNLVSNKRDLCNKVKLKKNATYCNVPTENALALVTKDCTYGDYSHLLVIPAAALHKTTANTHHS